MICVSADCSMGKKGPIYVPVTEMTPTIPITTKTIKEDE